MPTFYVKSRVTHPAEITTVDADTREGAIQQTIDAADEGDEVEVMQVQEGPFVEGVTGATGGTRLFGPAGTTGATGPNMAKPTRAQLNEMSKEELIAVAEQEGAEVNHSWTKSDIADAIVKHRRA